MYNIKETIAMIESTEIPLTHIEETTLISRRYYVTSCPVLLAETMNNLSLR